MYPIYVKVLPISPRLTPFALRSLVFQKIKVLDFSIGHNGEFEIFERQNR